MWVQTPWRGYLRSKISFFMYNTIFVYILRVPVSMKGSKGHQKSRKQRKQTGFKELAHICVLCSAIASPSLLSSSRIRVNPTTPARSGGEPQTGPQPRGANNHAPPPPADPSQEWQGAAHGALSQEWRGSPTTTGGATQPKVAGKHTQEPPPGVARDRPHTSHTPTHTNTSSKPQPGKKTATRRHTRANTNGRHTHTHTDATNTQHTHQHVPR